MCYPKIEFYAIRKANKLICLKIKYKYGFKHGKIYHYQQWCTGKQITHFQFTSKVFLSYSCKSMSYHIIPYFVIFNFSAFGNNGVVKGMSTYIKCPFLPIAITYSATVQLAVHSKCGDGNQDTVCTKK